jgi:ribosome biogenesis GTPase
VRAVSLWSSGRGIERAFSDVFDLSEECRFRDCKHEDEPGCAVRAAIDDGRLDPRRLDAMKRLSPRSSRSRRSSARRRSSSTGAASASSGPPTR